MRRSVAFQVAFGREEIPAPFSDNNFNQQEEVMEKKLLTLAIGTALMAGGSLAQAGVTVGGMAQVEYYNGTAECNVGTANAVGGGVFSGSGVCTATNSTKHKASGLIDNGRGRVIINADEEIGSWKALARYEFSVDTANSGQGAGANGNTSVYYDSTVRGFDQRTREKYVGLQGGFGTITLGNLHGVYKRLAGVRWDPFNATALEARSNGGQSGSDVSGQFAHNGFIPGAVKWESDKLMGSVFRLEVLVAPDSSSGVSAAGNSGNGYDHQIGFSVKPIKDLEIVAAYSNNKQQQSSASRDDATAAKIGARIGFGGNALWLQYEKADIDAGAGIFNLDGAAGSTHDATGVITVDGSPADASYLWLGYSLTIGSSQFVAQVYLNVLGRAGSQPEIDFHVARLAGDLAHYSYRDLADQIGRIQFFSDQAAAALAHDGMRFRLRDLVLRPPARFLRTFILRRGFLDGLPGFVISVASAFYVFLKYAKLWERTHRSELAQDSPAKSGPRP